jgi:hypothetical protein
MDESTSDLILLWKLLVKKSREREREMKELQCELGQLQDRLYRRQQSITVRKKLGKMDHDLHLLDKRFDPCIVGITRVAGLEGDQLPRVVYDVEKMIQVLIEQDGLSLESSIVRIRHMQEVCEGGRTPLYILQV